MKSVLRGREADVERLAGAVAVVRHHDEAHFGVLGADHFGRSVLRAVVDDDHRVERDGLRPDAVQVLPDVLLLVERGHHGGNGGPGYPGSRE